MRAWWTDHVVPRLVDRALDDRTVGPLRHRVCEGARGEVLELGFGSGRNLAHYSSTVTRVLAVEPADLAWARSAPQRAAFERDVDRIGLDGAAIDLPDGTVDSVVSTWTLCTIPDVNAALREVRRVLRPGGRLHLVEHGLAPSSAVRRVQRGLQPLWSPLAGGCHLDRDIPQLLQDNGFATDVDEAYLIDTALARPLGWLTTGTATPQTIGTP